MLDNVIGARRGVSLWLLVPALAILAIIQVYPSFYSVFLAFWRSSNGATVFVGFERFTQLIHSGGLGESALNTLVFTSVYVFLSLALALCLALLLGRGLRLRSLYVVILFIPWVLSDVVVGTIWRWMFTSKYGIVQEAISPLFGHSLLSSPVGAMGIVVVASVWHSLAFATLLVLAALRTVRQETRESAMLDGAGRVQIFARIELPAIRPYMLVALLLLTMRAVNSAGLILSITSGGPGRATNTLAYYLYQQAWRFGDFGMGAAIALLMTVMNLALAAVYIWMLGRKRFS